MVATRLVKVFDVSFQDNFSCNHQTWNRNEKEKVTPVAMYWRECELVGLMLSPLSMMQHKVLCLLNQTWTIDYPIMCSHL